MKMHKRSTEAIEKMAKKKSEETEKKVEQTIKNLIKNNQKINFSVVMKEAGVSKSYLYNHSEFRERIELLRNQQIQNNSNIKNKQTKRDDSKDTIIEALRYRIKELETELNSVKEENKKLNGILYDQI